MTRTAGAAGQTHTAAWTMYRRAGATASRCNRTDIASSQQQPTPRHGLTRSGRVLLSSASVCLVCACVLLSLLLCLGSPVSSSSPSTYSAGPVSFGRSGVEIHSSLLLGAWSCDSALTPSIVHVRVNAAEGDKLRVIVQTNTGEELSIGSHTAETRFDFSYARPSHLPVGAGLRVDHATSLRVTMQCKNSWFTCTQVRFDVDIRCETMPPNRAECTQRRDNTQQLRTDVQSVEVDKAGAIHIGWRIQQAESKADHSHPHSLFASVSVGWQLPSNYFTEQGALIGAGAPNVQRGCSMHWVPAPAFASNNHSMLSTGESSNATSHLRVVHGGPPTPQDLPDWIRVQISRDGQIVAEHYHAISARHWTALLYRQERAAPAINFGLIDLLSHLGLVPLLGDLVPAFIEADQQLRFLLLGSQDTCKSTVANGIYNLARVPPAKVTEADNSRPHFQPIVAPLLTGNGLGFATFEVAEVVVSAGRDSSMSPSPFVVIDTPGAVNHIEHGKASSLSLNVDMNSQQMLHRLLHGKHPQIWNVTEWIPQESVWFVNRMPHVVLLTLAQAEADMYFDGSSSATGRVPSRVLAIINAAKMVKRKVIMAITKPYHAANDVLRFHPFVETPSLTNTINNIRKVPGFGLVEIVPVLTYQEGAIALDNVIERSMLHLAHRLTHKAINAGATKQAHLLLQVRANPITMLCSALTGLTVIAMAAMFVTRYVSVPLRGCVSLVQRCCQVVGVGLLVAELLANLFNVNLSLTAEDRLPSLVDRVLMPLMHYRFTPAQWLYMQCLTAECIYIVGLANLIGLFAVGATAVYKRCTAQLPAEQRAPAGGMEARDAQAQPQPQAQAQGQARVGRADPIGVSHAVHPVAEVAAVPAHPPASALCMAPGGAEFTPGGEAPPADHSAAARR